MGKYRVNGYRWERYSFFIEVEAKSKSDAIKKAISAARDISWNGLDGQAEVDTSSYPKIERKNFLVEEQPHG